MSLEHNPFPQLSTPQKLIVVLWVFLAVIVCLLGLSYRTIEDLSAARAYVGGESLWSKAQKRAVYDLIQYSVSHSEADFKSYKDELSILLGDRKARIELESPFPRMAVVEDGFIQGRNNPEDVRGMATLFRRYSRSSYMAQAIAIWERSDRMIEKLRVLGDELHQEISSGHPDRARVSEITERIERIGSHLIPLEDRFSYDLGSGARRAEYTFLLVTFSATTISLLGGILFTILICRHVRQTEQRHRHLLNVANDAILAIEVASGHVCEANLRSSELLGTPCGHILGAPAEAFVAESDHEIYRTMMKAASAGGTVSGQELHLKSSDGGELTVEVNAVMTEFEGKRIIQGIFRDVRERKRLEEQNLQAKKLEVVGRLAAGIAHDFNNLLMVILTQLRKLDGSAGERKRSEPIETARAAAEKAVSLTSQMLSFGRSQALVLEVVDLNELLDELKEMLLTHAGERVRLIMSLSPEPLPVKVDAGKIEQVIMNLAVNACDAMPKGGRLIIKTASRQNSARSLVPDAIPCAILEVSDEGEGMDAETLSHAFEPFFTTKPVGKGTGLGLATAYGTVQQSGGSIEVESSQGVGSTIRVLLPLAEQPVLPRKMKATINAVVRGSETILLAEDQRAIRVALGEFLESEGYRVLEAENGNEAIEIAKTYAGTIDVLVADVIMPHLRGTAVAKSLTEARPGLRVILISGYSENALVEQNLLSNGDVTLIQKPFHPEDLAQRIRETLRPQSR